MTRFRLAAVLTVLAALVAFDASIAAAKPQRIRQINNRTDALQQIGLGGMTNRENRTFFGVG